MTTAVVLAVGVLVGLGFGYVGHEVAHWLVLRAAGYDDGLSLWPPHAGVRCPSDVPRAVRVAAVAPAAVGVVVLVVGFLAISIVGALGWAVAVGSAARLCYLSPADRALAKGRLPRL